MKLNQPLVDRLKRGEIILKNEPKNPGAIRKIIGRTNWRGEQNYYYYTKEGLIQHSSFANSYPTGMHVCGIKDFIIPDPKFKVGDRVKYKGPGKEEFKIGEVVWEGNHYRYLPENSKVGYSESAIDFAPAEAYTEQKFIIGQQYEFSVCNDWIKGTLLGIVDNQYKYIALVVTNKVPLAFDFIRPIQPRKIIRWINVCPSGLILRKSYETEQEAREEACQSGRNDCTQIKMEGYLP